MEDLDREHHAEVEELTREVEGLGQQALQKMKVSEKVFTRAEESSIKMLICRLTGTR